MHSLRILGTSGMMRLRSRAAPGLCGAASYGTQCCANVAMTFVVMACKAMAYIVMARIVMNCIVVACITMASMAVCACMGKACIVVA